MKRIIFILAILLVGNALHAQYVYTIKADSVKITNTCDTAELIIENHTQTVPGFLFNRGRGRTEFRRIAQLDDTSVVVGGDTIHLGRGNKNFANADLTFTGNRVHDGSWHSMTLQNFNGIHMISGTSDQKFMAKMTLWGGFGLNVNSPGGRIANFSVGSQALECNIEKSDGGSCNLAVRPDYFNISTRYVNVGGESLGFAGIGAALSDNFGTLDLNITDNGGNLSLINDGRDNGQRAMLNFWNGASIDMKCGTLESPSVFEQWPGKFVFRKVNGVNDFNLIGLPSSISTADSMLVVDDNGQVKKRPQLPTRTSVTVAGSAYTVPAGVDVVFVNYTAGQATITLPAGTLDREITIKNLHTTNTVIISGLDSNESNSIATRGAITVKYTGSAWVGISKY